MKHILNRCFKTKIAISVFMLLIGSQLVYSADIEGPSPVGVNSTHTYTFDDGLMHFFPMWQATGGGSVISTSINGTQYSAVVQWGAAGSGVITSTSFGTTLGSLTVTISTGFTVPNSPTISNHPGYTVLTKSGTPPTDVEWCWQNTAIGEDMSTSATALSVTLVAGTYYYLRAVDLLTGVWSDAITITYAVDLGPANVPTSISNENYIHTITPRIETTDVTTLNYDQKIETVTYFDGLGQAIQSVGIRTGGQSQDIITHIAYDPHGRQAKDYLPYAVASTGGTYRPEALITTNMFYNTTKYENTLNPYSEKHFEPSPLNRVLEHMAPGNDWKLGSTFDTNGHSNGQTIKQGYQTNTNPDDKIKNFGVSLSLASNIYTPTLTEGTPYATGELLKTITKDENWNTGDGLFGINHTSEVFTDKQGRVVLKRIYSTYPSASDEKPHDTNYIYDDFGNLSYVLTPKIKAFETGLNALILRLDELSYQYKYDDRNRLVEKKIPGKGWEYIIYDDLDRPIMTQDANQRAQSPAQWTFTKYDLLGRVAYTGLYNSNTSATILRGSLSAQNYESKVTSGTGYDGTYYTNNSFPTSSSALQVLTVNYYDDYNFDTATLVLPASYEGQNILNYDDNTPLKTKGLATGSKVKVLETTNDWITTITGYDKKGRPIYVTSHNTYLGIIDIVKSKLDFVGTAEKIETEHDKQGGPIVIKEENLFTYDHIGRLKTHTQDLNNTYNTPEVLVENTYDELGQLITKGVGGDATEARLQQVDFTYNIRGWLKEINNTASLGSDLFAFKINYNTQDHGGTTLYNGNIAETEWRTANTDNSLKWYTYQYDALNRLVQAIDNTPDKRYSITAPVDYDKNGNIEGLVRNGPIVAQPNASNSADFGFMDWLSYTYYPNSNKLQSVNETILGNNDYGFKDNSAATIQYDYDANGNMTLDLNKGITAIEYNHLNLPKTVTLSSGNIEYIYDAVGTKLKKEVNQTGQTQVSTSYAGSYIYEDTGTGDKLKFFSHSEGYAEAIHFFGTTFFYYVYQYKDHLGNIRLSYKDIHQNDVNNAADIDILEENNYYPFGLRHKGYNNNPTSSNIALKRMFNGKELQEELGLNTYDYGARMYDPALGRFMTIDPHADSYPWATPYNYAFNNPTLVIDPDGRDGIVSGSGTRDDPFVVRANYYYYDLNEKQINGLNDAASAYNNGGKSHKIKDGDGNNTYVQFNIGVTKADSAEHADELAKADYKDTADGGVARYGNVVNLGGASDDDHFGEAGRFNISLNQEKATSALNNYPGSKESDLIKGTFIHEIGHNIGGNHGDPGNIMAVKDFSETRKPNSVSNGGTGLYNYYGASVDKNGIRAIMGRVNMSPGSINSAYLSDKENKRVKAAEKKGTVGRLKTIN